MIEIFTFGQQALLINFEQKINEKVHLQVRQLYEEFIQKKPSATISIIPAYCSITLVFDMEKTTFDDLKKEVLSIYKNTASQKMPAGEIKTIPVCYDTEFAPDIKRIRDKTGLSKKEIIEAHTGKTYLVYMLGFTPGFPYMGALEKKLRVERKEKPRLTIDAGAVGIANAQTGIYPLSTPGGWNIIGRTPLTFFNTQKEFPLKMGDRVKFTPISKHEFHALKEAETVEEEQIPPTDVVFHEMIKPGQFTTIQDIGRFGYEAFGIPNSGFLDINSARTANELVGNDRDAPLLEIAMTGPEIKMGAHCGLALCGADISAQLNGQPIQNNLAYEVEKGDVLSFGHLKKGMRAYLAFSGELIADEVYGSSSTYLYGKIGGKQGRSFKLGDKLFLHPRPLPRKRLKASMLDTSVTTNPIIRLMKGPEFHLFDENMISFFLNNTFKVTEESNRMGFRLKGKKLPHIEIPTIISSGVVRGTIQLTPSDDLMVLLNDAGTIGGYPRVANILKEDIDKLTQKRPGEKIEFKLMG